LIKILKIKSWLIIIESYGRILINKELPEFEKNRIIEQIDEFRKIIVRPETIKVTKNISFGVFSPLEGFMNENDYKYVLDTIYLENDIAWPIPITLDVSEKEIEGLKVDDQIILTDNKGIPIALMNIEDIYDYG